MASGSGHRATRAARRARTTISSVSSRRSFRFARGRPASERPARVPVLLHQRRQLSPGHGNIHRPADPEHTLGEDGVARRIPVGGTQALDRGKPEVVRNDSGDLSLPGALGVRLAQLLVEGREERHPDGHADEVVEIFHATSTRRSRGPEPPAPPVPGCVAGIPAAQSGHSDGAYVAMSTRQRACTATFELAAPERSTSTAAPATVPPAPAIAAIVSCSEPPVVITSSTTSTRSPGARAKP